VHAPKSYRPIFNNISHLFLRDCVFTDYRQNPQPTHHKEVTQKMKKDLDILDKYFHNRLRIKEI